MKCFAIRTFFGFAFLISGNAVISQQNREIKEMPIITGEVWKDVDGKPINAHGAGILYHDNTYYLFGEIKKGKTWLVPNQNWEDYRVPAGGVSCYSSKDLFHWKYEGLALSPVTGDKAKDLDTSKVIERPKVIYNRQTGKFVMWMHIDANDYSYSQAGVAVSEKPTGPYTYLGSIKPNGQMARDMTLFKDDDDKAYLIYSSELNKSMHVCLLSSDYLSPTKNYSRITSAHDREAPAVFKYIDRYYLITSGCSGWSPNPATYAVADSLLGEWKQYDSPCIGTGAENTFASQSTYVLPLPGNSDNFIFMADRWNKLDLEDSRYVWLPLHMIDGKPVIKWIKK
ncbi:MAG: glycoside hydrolase family 43 protein [Ginsengibacter sp.]